MQRFADRIQRRKTYLHDWWVVNRARMGFVFATLLLVTFTWFLLCNPEAAPLIGRVVIVLLEVGALTLAAWFLVWRWRQRDMISVFPFQNLTGDPGYDGVATGFADLLTAEIQRIHHLHRESGWLGSKRQTLAPLRKKFLPTRLGEPPLAHISGSGGELKDTLKGVGAVGVGPLNIPLGSLLIMVLRVLQPGAISGNFQKHGDTLTIVVNLTARNRSPDKWVGQGRSGADSNVVGELASELAYRMINDTSPSIAAKSWQGFRAFSVGLEHYRSFLISGTLDQHALEEAKRSYETAVVLEPSFALAHYNLGVIYNESKMPEAAIEAYKLALLWDPDLVRAYHGLGLTYLEQQRVSEAVETLEQAVKMNPDQPIFQQALALVLIEAASTDLDSEVNTAFLERAADLYQKAIANYQRKIAEQSHLSDEETRLFRENQISAQRELGQTWFGLAHLYNLDKQEDAVLRALNRASEAFENALNLNYRDADSWGMLGDLHSQLESYEQAAMYFHEALIVEPYAANAHMGLGQVYLKHGDAILQYLEEAKSEELPAWQAELVGAQVEGFLSLNLAAAEFRAALDATFADWESEERRGESWHQAPPGVWEPLKQLALAVTLQMPSALERPIEEYSFRELSSLGPGEETSALPPEELRDNRIDAALRILNWALTLTPEEPDLHDGIAVLYERSGVDEAAQAHEWLRDCCAMYDDREEISQALEDVVEQTSEEDPARKVYLTTLGWLLRRQGNIEDAVTYLEEAMAADVDGWKEVPQVQHELGILYGEVEAYEKAVEAFHAAETRYTDEEMGDHLRTLLYLGDLYYSAGDYDEAIEAYNKAEELASENVFKRAQSLASRGLAYLAKKKYVKAIIDCQAAVELVPLYIFARLTLCGIYIETRDYERSIQEADEVIRMEPRYALSYQCLGDAYSSMGWACSDKAEREHLLKKATTAYQQAVESCTPEETVNKVDTLMSMAAVLMNRERYDEAVKVSEQAAAIGDELPNADACYRALGEAHWKNKSFFVAKEAFERAIELGRKLAKEEDEEARKQHQTEVALAQNLLAYMYAEQGVSSRFDEGFELIDKALKAAYDDDTKAACLDTRGWLYFQQGMYDEAIKDLEDALCLDLGTVDGVYHLARVYEAKASTCEVENKKHKLLEAAQMQWNRVLELEPEGKWAQEACMKKVSRVTNDALRLPKDE